MTKLKRYALILSIVLVNLILDQLTKSWAIEALKGRPMSSYWGDLFRFQYAENPGAFLSLGAGLSDDHRYWLLTVVVGGFLLGFLVYVFLKPMSLLSTTALSLVLGGGISNLIDRVFRTEGRVVDFMNMGIGSLRTGVFNIADMAIMLGTGLLLLDIFNENRRQQRRA